MNYSLEDEQPELREEKLTQMELLIHRALRAAPFHPGKASRSLRVDLNNTLPPCSSSDLGGPTLPYVSRSGVSHFFVEADIQVVARFIRDKQADGYSTVGGGRPYIDLDLGLQHAEFPQPATVAHDHGAHRLLDLSPNTGIPVSEPTPQTHWQQRQ